MSWRKVHCIWIKYCQHQLLLSKFLLVFSHSVWETICDAKLWLNRKMSKKTHQINYSKYCNCLLDVYFTPSPGIYKIFTFVDFGFGSIKLPPPQRRCVENTLYTQRLPSRLMKWWAYYGSCIETAAFKPELEEGNISHQKLSGIHEISRRKLSRALLGIPQNWLGGFVPKSKKKCIRSGEHDM